MKLKKEIAIGIVLIGIIICVGIVYTAETHNDESGQKSTVTVRNYKIKILNLSLDYPKDFTVVERLNEEDKISPVLLTFSSDRGQVTFLPSVLPIDDMKKERSINDTALFQDGASRMKNARISIAGFEGFKLLVDFNRSQYLLYKELSATSTLRVQAEIFSESPDKLLDIENNLISMLQSISSN